MDDARPVKRAEPPPAALWAIAIIALAPFPAAAITYCYGPPADRTMSLSVLFSWSALVLAFLGGVRWGMETREPEPRWQRQAFYALAAAAGLAVLVGRGMAPDAWLLTFLIVAFLIQWLFDNQVPDTPSRYPSLSTALTAAAGVSLALALEKTINR